MISSNMFNYINTLDKAADASWMRKTAIANNIANVDTPNYKRQDVDFESVFQQQLRSTTGKSLDDKVKNISLNKLTVSSYEDSASFAYRLDGNNVDIDTENVQLASEQLRYQALTDSMSNEFTRLKMVMNK